MQYNNKTKIKYFANLKGQDDTHVAVAADEV
jgi:hypothetical protein